ncbi:MAG: DUF411 domain-containing protein [Microcoleaceae cyanobacterium]
MSKKFSNYWIPSLIASVALVAGVTYFAITDTHPFFNSGIASNLSSSQLAANDLNITVYRTPTCGCCEGWVEHLQQHNFNVTDIVKPEAEINKIRQKHNLPTQLTTCHAAEINGYLVEGHVPAEDVKNLIAKKPNISGIVVPGMPVGSPGMEMGDRKESFDVMSFKNNQIEVFNSYSY